MTIQFLKIEVSPYGMAPSDESEALKLIEVCGRTAYKSEDKINNDSAKAFVLMLKRHGHLSVLEHSNAVFKVRADKKPGEMPMYQQALTSCLKERNAYHRIHPLSEGTDGFAIAGNFRGWIETLHYLKNRDDGYYRLFASGLKQHYSNLFESQETESTGTNVALSLLSAEDQLAILTEDLASDLPVFVFKIICDRGITHEIVRHRVLSFTQESTRYVNYKNKGMTLMIPEELDPYYDSGTGQLKRDEPLVKTWESRAMEIFKWYQDDVARGRRPEIARDILPNLLKSEIFVSGRWSGWKHFIELRDSKQAHPRIRKIAQEIRQYFESIGLRCE